MKLHILKKMQNSAASLFRDAAQRRLFWLLTLTSIFGIFLLIGRLYIIGYDFDNLSSLQRMRSNRTAESSFLFLLWNLFLAWVPYWIALVFDLLDRRLRALGVAKISKAGVFFLLFFWLLFFPNSPYIVTDLLHLHAREAVPHWFDVMIFITFAWAGLMLGFASLFEVQRYLEHRFSSFAAWICCVSAIFLGGFGVFMGRFQRWNSWDIFHDPFKIVFQQIKILTNPMAHLETLGLVFVLSIFMLLGYLTLTSFRTTT
jgi:uncharacterized membrane protein